MKRILTALALCLGLSSQALAASTTYQATQGSGSPFGAWCVSGTGSTCSGGAFWPGTVIVNSSGVELFTSGNAAYVQFPSAQAVTAAQATAANLNATVVGTGTFAIQANGFTSWAGGTLGAMANYGTSPGAVLVPGVNAFVTNANTNGAASVANSSPVTPSNQPVGAANFAPAQVSVGSSATVIAAARTGVSGTGRVSVTVTNTTTTAIYLGGSGVTTTTGTLLPGIVGASVTINTTAAVYGIITTGTATVTEFETY